MSTFQYTSSGMAVPPHNIAVATSATRTNLYCLEVKQPGANLPSGNTLNSDALVLAAGGVLVASLHYDSSGNIACVYNSNAYGF